MLLLVLLIGIGLLLLVSTGGTSSRTDSPSACIYDVILDAGSTGSRVHVFEFKWEGSRPKLISEYYKRVQPGLSSFALDPHGAVNSLRPIMEAALTMVPVDRRASTSVALKATAGIRLLPQHQQNAILNAVDSYLSGTPLRNRGASLMSGAEEGVGAWLTVNYLLGNLFFSSSTVATVDMGGASSQIVFETAESDGAWLPYHYVSNIRIGPRRVTLYHYSYLGLGLNEARKAVKGFLSPAQLSSCEPRATGNGRENFDRCAVAVKAALFSDTACRFASCGAKGVPQPSIPATGKAVYTFSYFYDRLHAHIPPTTPADVSTIRNIGSRLCGSSLNETKGETVCLDTAYLYVYLTQGLGLEQNAQIQVADSIGGHSISWPLGSSLAHILGVEV